MRLQIQIVLLIIVIGGHFTETARSLQKFHWWPCESALRSHVPFNVSDFHFFVEQNLSQPFYHLIVDTIQFLVAIWATPFGYLLLGKISFSDYPLTYYGSQIENMDETYQESTVN